MVLLHKFFCITMNTFGQNWSFTSFGESHGAAIGGVLDGVPAGMHIDFDLIRRELDRRAGREVTGDGVQQVTGDGVQVTGDGVQVTGVSVRAKNEPDEVEWLSGVIVNTDRCADGVQRTDLITLGTPIAFLIRNRDARPEDYEALRCSFRVGHADRTYQQKYGIRDWRGGGRASARETAARVVAGCLARQTLAAQGVSIRAELVQVGTETDPNRFPETIARYQREGDSIGGIIACTVSGLPAGTGEPLFHKLQAELAFAILSINACKGFEYGTGFAGVGQPGSAINAISGGIAGGISDGTDLFFRCVFKPTPSTPKAGVKGRHDACVAVRAVPVVEAMTALCLADLLTVR